MNLDTTKRSSRSSKLLAPRRVELPRWVVVVETGAAAGETHGPLNEHTVIGREAWCDISLNDVHASKRHCELTLAADAVRLRDLGSTNGTFCGGMRVNDVLLGSDGRFRVGETTFRLVLQEGSQCVFRRPTDATGTLVGSSAGMQKLFVVMGRVAPHDISVLLMGETGTGKTAVARAIHALSQRASRPFVAINCAAIPASLVESTLFGQVRGAFSGAHRSTTGIFEQADGGSVLLDEIGDMPLELQTSLLRVLETRRIQPVGAESEAPVDFRLFCATNRNLPQEVAAGRFRRDLYYRISGLDLTVPPLRDRAEDLPALVQYFIERAIEESKRLGRTSAVQGISDEALARLERHSWPGNVRELENVIAGAMTLSETDLIQPSDVELSSLQSEALDALPRSAGESHRESGSEAGDAVAEGVETFREFKALTASRYEREYFKRLLESTAGNISRAAQLGGISRTYLKLVIKKHGL